MTRRIGAWVTGASLALMACAASPGVDVEDATRVSTADDVASTDDTVSTDDVTSTDVVVSTDDVMSSEPATTVAAPTSSASDPSADVEAVGAPGAGDSLYPTMGNGGYDVGHYALDLDVEVEGNRLEGVATIDARSTQRLESFHLDLAGLDVSEVTVDGADADVEHADGELAVTPVTAIDEGTPFTVEVRYSGVPEPIRDPGVPFDTIGWHQREGTIYVASEPSGAASWFPSNNHPSDKATFDITVTTASDLTVVSNGVLDVVENHGDGTATTTWVMDDPMTTYLATLYIGDFELRESTTPDGLRIRNYFPPPFADDLEADFELTADVIDFYEELFAADYPFAEYGSIVVPFGLGFALENQTISLHGLDATDPYTIAHEILHQWAGNSVTVADWQDIWMNEGFATYLAYMYFEDRGLSSDIEPRGMYAALGNASIGPAEVPIEELFGLSVYFRGGMALHALRVEVGDEVFGEIMQAYYAGNAGERVSTEEFLAVVDDVAGDDAVAVLDDWLYGTDLPDFPT